MPIDPPVTTATLSASFMLGLYRNGVCRSTVTTGTFRLPSFRIIDLSRKNILNRGNHEVILRPQGTGAACRAVAVVVCSGAATRRSFGRFLRAGLRGHR